MGFKVLLTRWRVHNPEGIGSVSHGALILSSPFY
jgi:hypothetical protein